MQIKHYPLPFRGEKEEQQVTISRALSWVAHELTRINQEETKRLAYTPRRQLEAAFVSIRAVRQVQEQIYDLQKRTPDFDPDETVEQLTEMAVYLEQLMPTQSRCPESARCSATLNDVASLLHRAEARIVPFLQGSETPCVKSMLVPSDVLYQAYDSLFPAERMLVVAGNHLCCGVLRLGAAFDVTDTGPETHTAHVRADPDKLGRALKMMDFSGTELGAWVHSHPGQGAGATRPSPIDTTQHTNWLRHYPKHLLSIIMVSDGYLRMFGQAVESGKLLLRLTGQGITQEETHVYKLSRKR